MQTAPHAVARFNGMCLRDAFCETCCLCVSNALLHAINTTNLYQFLLCSFPLILQGRCAGDVAQKQLTSCTQAYTGWVAPELVIVRYKMYVVLLPMVVISATISDRHPYFCNDLAASLSSWSSSIMVVALLERMADVSACALQRHNVLYSNVHQCTACSLCLQP